MLENDKGSRDKGANDRQEKECLRRSRRNSSFK